MALTKLARFEVRPDARADAERAMHDYASYVHRELLGTSWSTYREPSSPGRYVAVIHATDAAADARQRDAPGTQAFAAALAPLLAGAVELAEYELVTSSDLGRRAARVGRGRQRPR